MKIAILSGKGGAGKTLIAVNLAVVAKYATYIDCDVEEPNGRLFFKPQENKQQEIYTLLPSFSIEKCTGCRKCVEFCRFNALVYIKNKPQVFSEICHACGGCQLVCPEQAITEIRRSVGIIEIGKHKDTRIITGILNFREASGIPIIQAAKQAGDNREGLTILDCPPGSACSVMESIVDADYCILVVEPTAFGFHNFQMVYELVKLLHKNCGIVINKMNQSYEPLEHFCQKENISILCRIPYDERIAHLAASGEIIAEVDEESAHIFRQLLVKVREAVQ